MTGGGGGLPKLDPVAEAGETGGFSFNVCLPNSSVRPPTLVEGRTGDTGGTTSPTL